MHLENNLFPLRFINDTSNVLIALMLNFILYYSMHRATCLIIIPYLLSFEVLVIVNNVYLLNRLDTVAFLLISHSFQKLSVFDLQTYEYTS